MTAAKHTDTMHIRLETRLQDYKKTLQKHCKSAKSLQNHCKTQRPRADHTLLKTILKQILIKINLVVEYYGCGILRVEAQKME